MRTGADSLYIWIMIPLQEPWQPEKNCGLTMSRLASLKMTTSGSKPMTNTKQNKKEGGQANE
jgi:hypothetical protein